MKKIIKRIAVIITVIAILTVAFSGLLLAYARKNIDYNSDEELFRKAKDDQTIYYYAYDRNGELTEVYKSSKSSIREWTDFADIGENLKMGFLAAEDRRFYEHKGVNYKRTVAAIINHVFKFTRSFGASTITQQVVKNISGDNETKVSRKLKEILRAFNLERNHSKDDIFELYLNIVPMSGNVYGVGAASEIYFGKEPAELSLSEAATLVGITNAPTKYNPYTNPDECLGKRNRVLYAMLDAGVIDRLKYEEAINSPLKLNYGMGNFGVSSWFVETANEEIISDISSEYGLSRAAARLMLNGTHVILTMNPTVQKIMENYFFDTSNLSEKFSDGLNYSMVISDPYTGDLLGIIGNGGEKRGELLFNYATTPIIPGSVIKPIALYAPLLDKGEITWSTMLEDTPIEYIGSGDGSVPYPKNTPDVYEGLIDINKALKKSKNTIAIRLYDMLGAEYIFNHLKNDYGFATLVSSETLSTGGVISDMNAAPLALGQLSRGVSLRKLTEAYNVFPNEGVLCSGRSYRGIYDRDGKTVITKARTAKRLYSQETAQIMNQLLSNVVLDGTARQINLKENVDTAGKTGTSGNDRDRLFIGYTPYYTAGIWCGFGKSDRQVGHNTPSHLHIWDEVMKRVHDELVLYDYEENERIFNTDKVVVAPYCPKSGLIPTEWCELDDEVSLEFGYFDIKKTPKCECDYRECQDISANLMKNFSRESF